MSKKEWLKPEVLNLELGCTNEEVACPMEPSTFHPGNIILPQCPHYCETHSACGLGGLSAALQLLCPRNILKPIKNCSCKEHEVDPGVGQS